jgi:hypothetical protein
VTAADVAAEAAQADLSLAETRRLSSPFSLLAGALLLPSR